MGKKDNKKKKFAKRLKLRRDKKKKNRKLALKKIVSPKKHLKNLTADKIREYLEDAPFIQQEPEFDGFHFNEELLKTTTLNVYEKYKDKFAETKDKESKKKRELYEDFCVETVSKLVSKPFIVSMKRRLKLAANRLKREGNQDQMMRAIVSDATLNLPQIPIEAHPLVVGIYEDLRLKVMADEFVIEGFEEVMYWKKRVAQERDEDRTGHV